MGALISKCVGNDPKKVGMIAEKAFGVADKDKSGFVTIEEARPLAEKVLKTARVPGVKPGMVDTAFAKVAGADGKLDKAEFVNLIQGIVAKTGGPKAPVGATAAAAAPVAAAAGATAPH